MHLPQNYQDTEHEVFAHVSPSELRELTRMQGSEDLDHQTGLPKFSRLWETMQHPHMYEKIVDWGRKGFSNGGEVGGSPRGGLNRALEDSGVHGDTKYVKLPRPMADLFDYALYNGRPSLNQHTGRRQYFLGGLLGGLGRILGGASSFLSPAISALKPIAGGAISALAPTMGNLAQGGLTALGTSMGMPGLGGIAGSVANHALSGLASNIGQSLSGGTQMNPQQMARQTAGAAATAAAPHMGNYAQQLAQRAGNYAGVPNFGNAMGGLANQAVQGMVGNASQDFMNGNQMDPMQYARNAGANALNTAAPMASNYVNQFATNQANRFADSPVHPHLISAGNLASNFVNHGMNNFANYVQGSPGTAPGFSGDYLEEGQMPQQFAA